MWLLKGRGAVLERDIHTQREVEREEKKKEMVWEGKERDIFHERTYNNVILCNGFQ